MNYFDAKMKTQKDSVANDTDILRKKIQDLKSKLESNNESDYMDLDEKDADFANTIAKAFESMDKYGISEMELTIGSNMKSKTEADFNDSIEDALEDFFKYDDISVSKPNFVINSTTIHNYLNNLK